MILRLEAQRMRSSGRLQVAITITLVADEAALSLDDLTDRCMLLHDDGMRLLTEQASGRKNRDEFTVAVNDNDADPAVLAATLDVVRSTPATTNTPPESAAARTRMRAELIRIRRKAGYSV